MRVTVLRGGRVRELADGVVGLVIRLGAPAPRLAQEFCARRARRALTP